MIKIGTCSWNYPSWKGLVYTDIQPTAAGYLAEYSQHYKTVEIDSWFYHLPDRAEVEDYLKRVDSEFTFTCKVSEGITLTHVDKKGKRAFNKATPIFPNPNFLSADLFGQYLSAIEPMIPQIDAIEFEFEYLNRDKMPSLAAFLEHLDRFFAAVPKGLPYAVEVRNKDYLCKDYFKFLKERGIAHVFSEKLYLPHIWEVYEQYHDLLSDLIVIRLLGGDRKDIELKTKEVWNSRVEPKDGDLERIISFTIKTQFDGKKVIVSINNHYEGSSPLTIAEWERYYSRLKG